MKNIMIALLMLLTTPLWAQTPVQQLAAAIGRAEGFGVKGTKPTRYHNPGDLRCPRGVKFPGQRGTDRFGYAIFRRDADGWAALDAQINLIIDGQSHFYSANDSLEKLARAYATSPTWVKNVAKALGVPPKTQLWQILDCAPALSARPNPHALDFLFGN